MSVLIVTGTGTGVGKTIVTAAVAALARASGQRVAVVKPAQTGIADGEESDIDVVRRLSGVEDVHEFVRYLEPLAPATAARRTGVTPMPVTAMVDRISELLDRDFVIVEGAGGLLVHLDDIGGTLADVAGALHAPVLVVAAAGLGTLNAIALTCEALRNRSLTCRGIVFGSWPRQPGVAETENLRDAERYAGVPVVGTIAEGASGLEPGQFLRIASESLAPELHGRYNIGVARP